MQETHLHGRSRIADIENPETVAAHVGIIALHHNVLASEGVSPPLSSVEPEQSSGKCAENRRPDPAHSCSRRSRKHPQHRQTLVNAPMVFMGVGDVHHAPSRSGQVHPLGPLPRQTAGQKYPGFSGHWPTRKAYSPTISIALIEEMDT